MTTTTTGWLTLGTVTPSGSSFYQQSFTQLVRSRTASARRPRPKGVERLFNGTGGSAMIQSNNPGIGVYANYNKLDGRWSNTTLSMVEGNVTPGETAIGLPTTYSQSEWSNQLRKKLKDTSLNLAQAFAERKQTEKMFVDFGSRLVKAYRAVRKGRPHDVYSALTGGKTLPKGWKRGFKPDVLKTASDNWLAWQYGVRPLVSDMSGAITEYLKVRGVPPLIRNVHLRTPKKAVSGNETTYQESNPLGRAMVDSCVMTLTGRITCYAEFESGQSSWDQTAARLGLTSPALLLWELIPYSFVIDWFLQVGEFLEAQGSITGLKRVGIHVSSTYVQNSSRSLDGGVGHFLQRVITREFYNTLPGATLRWGSGIRSFSRTASALALIRAPLASMFSKR